MRTKGSVLIMLILSLGTAVAMAVSRDESATSNVDGVAGNKTFHADRSGTEQLQQPQTDIRFDLSAIKRIAPKNIQTSGLFQSKSWYVPPPPPPQASLLPPPPPPVPSAPQLPFRFIGRMIDRSDVTLFLTNNDRHYTAKLSDVLDGNYRVDKITETSAVLTYLPMNIQQELVFNSTAVGISALNVSASDTTMQPPAQTQQQIEPTR